MLYIVYLPPANGKVAGWLRGTIWTTYADRASRYPTACDAQAAIDKARKFHLRRVMARAKIQPAPAMAKVFAEAAPNVMIYEFDPQATEDQQGDVHITTFRDGSKFYNDAASGETRWEATP